MASPNLSEIVTTTLYNRSGRIADNVSNNNALLQRLNERGRVRPVSGGRQIVEELDYQANSTFKYYSGYELFDITPADVISSAVYDWKQAVVVVSISGLEGDIQNSGPEAVHNLLEARLENAERTMANSISNGIYSDGTGSAGKEIGGLQLLVADAGTGTVGGINSTTFTFWQNYTFDATTTGGAAATAANIKGYMQTVWLNLTRGRDMPDLLVADQNYFQFFWESMTDIQRVTSEASATSGFRSLQFASASVVYDGDSGIPANHMYFLNTNYLMFRPHIGRNFIPLPERASLNQDATIVPLIWAGALTTSNRSLQGVLKD